MSSLADLCCNNIADNVAKHLFSAPPTLQEQVLGITAKLLQSQADEEAWRKLTAKLRILPAMILTLLEEEAREQGHTSRLNLHNIYSDVPAPLVDVAIQTVDHITNQYVVSKPHWDAEFHYDEDTGSISDEHDFEYDHESSDEDSSEDFGLSYWN